jgi:hypothetical protein
LNDGIVQWHTANVKKFILRVMMMGIHTIQGDHGILQGHISHSCSQRVHNNTFRDEDPEESNARLKTIMQIV